MREFSTCSQPPTIQNGNDRRRFEHGQPGTREYGTEQLEISAKAIDLSRVFGTGVPILDSHQQIGISNVLGRVVNAWVSDSALIGTLAFARTEQGINAEAMVSRKEITSLSIGYRTQTWLITTEDGDVVDPAVDRLRWTDDNLIFTAKRWQLLECSLVSMAADAASHFRSVPGVDRALPNGFFHIINAKARMAARQRMHDRIVVHRIKHNMAARSRMIARQSDHWRVRHV